MKKLKNPNKKITGVLLFLAMLLPLIPAGFGTMQCVYADDVKEETIRSDGGIGLSGQYSITEYTMGVGEGHIQTSTNTTLANAGEIVRVSGEPDNNYFFYGFMIGEATSGNRFSVSADTPIIRSGSFEMPDENISLMYIFYRKNNVPCAVTIQDGIENGHIEIVNDQGESQTSFARGETVTIKATPNSGYKLDRIGWTDLLTAENPDDFNWSREASFEMPDWPVKVVAVFTETSGLTVTANADPVGKGKTSVTPGPDNVTIGGYVVQAFYLTAEAEEGYVFDYWECNGEPKSTKQNILIYTNKPLTYTAHFREPTQYTVTVTSNDDTLGTVTGGGTYAEGSLAILTATPAEGCAFERWEDGDMTSNTPTIGLTVKGNRTIKAVFKKLETYTIITAVSPQAGGTVTGGGTYAEGTKVVLKAQPNDGYVFAGWREEDKDLGSMYTLYPQYYDFYASGNRTITAVFNPVGPVNINLSVYPEGKGTVSGGGTYTERTNATITATPAEGYVFFAWEAVQPDPRYNFFLSESNPYSFEVEKAYENINFRAHFIKHDLKIRFDMQGKGAAPDPLTANDKGLLSSESQFPVPVPDENNKSYAFAGWYYDQACTQKAKQNHRFYDDTTLYAKWVFADIDFEYEEIDFGILPAGRSSQGNQDSNDFVSWLSYGMQVPVKITYKSGGHPLRLIMIDEHSDMGDFMVSMSGTEINKTIKPGDEYEIRIYPNPNLDDARVCDDTLTLRFVEEIDGEAVGREIFKTISLHAEWRENPEFSGKLLVSPDEMYFDAPGDVQTVTVTNDTNGLAYINLSLLASGYDIHQDWPYGHNLYLGPGASHSFTVERTYDAQTVRQKLMVNAHIYRLMSQASESVNREIGLNYSKLLYSLSQDVVDFGTQVYNSSSAPPAEQTVTLSYQNDGGTIWWMNVYVPEQPTCFSVSAPTDGTGIYANGDTPVSGSSISFKVAPRPGLPPGEYEETIHIPMTVAPYENFRVAADVTLKYTVQETFPVVVESDDFTHGIATAKQKTALSGTEVELNAEPINGYGFDRWEILEGDITLADPYSANTTFKMGFTRAKVRAHFKKYSVYLNLSPITVQESEYGTGTATPGLVMSPGVTVELTASPNENYRFDRWEVVSGNAVPADPHSAQTTFISDGNPVTLRPVFTLEANRTVTILYADGGTGGTAVSNPSSAALVGSRVRLSASPKKGYHFVRWNVLSGGVTLADPTLANTSFIMEQQDVVVQPVFEYATAGVNLVFDQNVKKEYNEGESLDVSGMYLLVVQPDGRTDTIPVTKDMVTGYDNAGSIEQLLTIHYDGYTFRYIIKMHHTSSSQYRLSLVDDLTYCTKGVETVAVINGLEKNYESNANLKITLTCESDPDAYSVSNGNIVVDWTKVSDLSPELTLQIDYTPDQHFSDTVSAKLRYGKAEQPAFSADPAGPLTVEYGSSPLLMTLKNGRALAPTNPDPEYTLVSGPEGVSLSADGKLTADWTTLHASNTPYTVKVKRNGTAFYNPKEMEISLTVTEPAKTDISSWAVEGLRDLTYTGKALEQKDLKVVKDGVYADFTAEYKDNVNAGTATVTITGTGSFTGTITAKFTIIKAKQKITLSTSSLKLEKGKSASVKVTGAKGTVTFASADRTTASVGKTSGKIKAKSPGTVKIKVTVASTENYEPAVKTVTVKVVPRTPSDPSLRSKKNGFRISWKQSPGVNGFQLVCSTKKNFSSDVKKYSGSAGASGRTVKNLRSGTRYYVRIRFYKTVDGKRYYSSWSRRKSVKTK